MNRMRATLTGLALCAAAVMATSALAEEPGDSIDVHYVATDLARPEGAEALYRHIQRAAQLVCHEPNVRADLQRFRLYQQCYERAVDTAVAKVDSSALTALHRSKTHGAAG
jgi:UrcA family protein